ncbi:MAG TPA: HD domain-containing phosphohydrolase [Candidatus Acidoferrum sp.]|nr:HD domain-containing phosphohydrolase [Candidatus Acidoferrum sp.]
MNPTILLVDIASEERENWKAFLENQKYEVFTAATPETARQLCAQFQPDLVLLHDHLPQVRGLELCRRLKQDPLNQLTPIVLISSVPTPMELEQSLEAGAADFWGMTSSLSEGLCRIQTLLRLKSYIDEQAKCVVLALARSIEAKHCLTDGHSDRLAHYALRLGESLGLGEEDLEELRLGSLLHDIGKVAVPDDILLKPNCLNAQEMEIMRHHPITGEQICAPLKSLRPILPIIRHHHERMNGSGYPDGLHGGEIPLKARILQVVDVYDALISARPYREALSSEEALEILRQEAMQGWIDASLAGKFTRICQAPDFLPVRGRSMLASYYA